MFHSETEDTNLRCYEYPKCCDTLFRMRNNVYMRNLPSLVVFATVVNKGGFTNAAEELLCSKASVSRHINSLEERIGFKILHRTTRSVTLTPQGEELFSCCQRIINSMDEANLLIDGIISEPRGELRVAAPLAFTLLETRECIARFLVKYPKVLVDLEITDRKFNLAQEGVDIAFCLGHAYDTSYSSVLVNSFSMVICGSSEYFERAGVPTSIEELALHDCIIEQSGGVAEPWRIGPDRVVNVSGRKLRSNSGRVAREAALAGLGLAYLPSYLVGADIAAGRLRSVLSDFVDVQLPLFALYPTHHRTARVKAFISFLRDDLSSRPVI